MSVKNFAWCVVVASAVIGLSGCAVATPPAAPLTSSSPTQAAEPAPEPSVEAVVADRIVVLADGVSIINSDDSVALETTYFDATDDLVEALTEIAGVAPSRSDETFHERGDFERIEWPGFVILDDVVEAEQPYLPGFSVFATESQLGEVEIVTVGGVAVGDSLTDAAQAQGVEATRKSNEGAADSLFAFVGEVLLPTSAPDAKFQAQVSAPSFSVWLLSSNAEGHVDDIRAPSPNFGP